jgi:hypothetical protein
MNLKGVVVVAGALCLGAHVLTGVRLSADLTTLEQVGTLLVVAMLFTIVDGLARVVRRAVRLLIEPLPLMVAVVLVLNGLLVWLTAALASAAGLAFSIDSFVTAVLAWLIVGACRGFVPGSG